MATSNAPAGASLKGTARKFLKAKVGPVPVPLIAAGGLAGLYILHKRGALGSAGATSSTSADSSSDGSGGGMIGGGGSGGSGGSGGGAGDFGGGSTVIGRTLNRNRYNIHRTTYKGKFAGGGRKVFPPSHDGTGNVNARKGGNGHTAKRPNGVFYVRGGGRKLGPERTPGKRLPSVGRDGRPPAVRSAGR